MVDPKEGLRDFLRTNLTPGNISVTFTNADDIVIANYDGGAGPYPKVAVVSKDSIILGGGETGVTAIDQANDGPVQRVTYRLQVDCWGGPEDADIYQSEGSHADTVANELGEEVHATCRVGSDGAPSGYGWMMAEPPFENDDTEEHPTEHRETVIVRMGLNYGP